MKANERLAVLLAESGAVAFGATPVRPVDEGEWQRFENWLDQGFHASMGYMANHKEIRRNPGLLMPGARTIISIAFNYRQPNPYPGVATYALGHDYHKVLRKRLKKVVGEMSDDFGGDWRICIDSAPILERYWALQCGIAFRSPGHGNVVVPGVGSMVFLAEILTSLPIEFPSNDSGKALSYAESMAEGTESAQNFIKCCPTGALQPEGVIDSRRCLNYLTIEHRGDFSPVQKDLLSRPGARGAIFGCDICQRCAPENQGVALPVLPEFSPLADLPQIIENLRKGDFPSIPKSSPLSRKR